MRREAFGFNDDFFNAHLLFIMQFMVANTLVKVYLLDEEYNSGSGQHKDHRLGALPNSGTVSFYLS